MLATTITTALIYLTLQNSGVLALGTACWDERLTRAGRNSSCVAPQPFLIFGHGKAIHRMDLDGKNHRRLVSGVATSILLDVHFREETLYWADKHTGIIYKSSVRGVHRQKLYSSDKHISGLAVNWMWNVIYWTSGDKGKVKRIDTNGKNESTLVRHLTQPSSIVTDPAERFLFWLSGGITSSIQRSDVTGQRKTTLIKISQQLKALSIDHRDKRLFWVQFGLQGESAIASSDYSGKALHIIDQPLQFESLGISFFHQYIYYTDAASLAIKRVNKYTGGEPVDVNIKQMTKVPVDIKVVHADNQPMADSPSPPQGCDERSGDCVNACSSGIEQGLCKCSEGFALSKQGSYCEDVNECAHWNHGCSLGCENIPGSYFCTCPNGYALLPDKKTCREIITCEGNATECGHGCLATDEGPVCVCPKGSILQEDGQACTGCSSADRGGCSQLCTPIVATRWQCACLPGYQLHQDGRRCIASGPPPYLLIASLVGVQRLNTDGTEGQILVEEPRGAIISLDYDPVHNNIYFASTSQKTIERIDMNGGSRRRLVSDHLGSTNGLTIDWIHRKLYWTVPSQSSVVSSTLDGLNRTTLLRDGLDQPTSIAVHPREKKLFWADIGLHPKVESSTLDGTNRTVIASTDLVSPSGLTVDFTEDRLFWCDGPTVETSALDGSDRRILLENQVGRPFDLAVFEDRLWVVDRENQQLTSVHKRTGKELQHLHVNLVQPASVVVVHPLAKPEHADVEPANPTALPNNTTLGDERTTHNHVDVESRSFTNKMVSDQHECHSATCGPNANCHLNAGSPACSCLKGFASDGHFCVDTDECKLGTHDCDQNADCLNTEGDFLCKCQAGYHGNGHKCQALQITPPSVMTSSPADVKHQNSNSVESCPSTHESYCLYQGVCFYFPEMETYACNCVSGYMGERCQFSDLEWWELQQAEKEKRRNVVIAVCMVVLVCLLSVAACVTYCCRSQGLFSKQPSVDNVSETSVTEEDVSDSIKDSVPQVSTVVENDPKGITLTAAGCPRRAVCPSCSSEAGNNQSEEMETWCKNNQGYECSMVSSVVREINQTPPLHHTGQLPNANTCISMTVASVPHTSGPEPSASCTV
ncbi:pro-epidermal growth factor [Dunckerocampus dactyliophorus]|uniref:pro-epidermal growth factor n=1 Tax=Dunckerocampus dactyliophorus TaxID=161453 RepID=UPI0024057185|nr:pro-epidermal growth factor [Dunckerocampus dactyliophorus]